jgi:hypothetical protein
MSVISALDNLNRVVRAQGVTTASAGNTVYVTIPNWPNYANLSRVIINASQAYSNVTATILSDGAAFRAGTAGAYIQGSGNDTATNVSASAIAFTPSLYVEDALHAGCLYVRLTGTFTSGTVFTVTAIGSAALGGTTTANERTGVSGDRTWRVLSQPAGSTALDRTILALQNGNPYGIGNTNTCATWTALAASTDTLLMGAARPFTKVLALVPNYSSQPAGTALTAQYWNGTAWATATVADNTSDGQAVPSSFSTSGVIELTLPSDWAAMKLPTDPLTIEENGIIAGTQPAIGQFNNPARYWLQLSLSGLSGTLKLAALLPLL